LAVVRAVINIELGSISERSGILKYIKIIREEGGDNKKKYFIN
jgi:hypothetical protein